MDGDVLTLDEMEELLSAPWHLYRDLGWDEFLSYDAEQREDYFSLYSVMWAYYVCRRHKRGTANAICFELFWEDNCIKLWEQINNNTYRPGRSIAFVVVDPKPREVFAAQFRDRIVHHLITNEMSPIFESMFVDNSYSTRPGKGTLYGINHVEWQLKRLTDNYKAKEFYIMKLDVKGFFMHIDKRIMFSMLKNVALKRYRKKNCRKLIELMRIVVFHRPELDYKNRSPKWKWDLLPKDKSLFYGDGMHGLPIGNVTSQLFALLFMNYLDQKILREHPGIGYGRYVDDFVVMASTKEELLQIREEIDEWLHERGMALNRNKMYLQHYKHGVSFVGGTIRPGRKYMGERTIHRMDNKLRYYNCVAERKGGAFVAEKAYEFYKVMNSYLGFLCHYSEYKLMRRFIDMVAEPWYGVMNFHIRGRRAKVLMKPHPPTHPPLFWELEDE